MPFDEIRRSGSVHTPLVDRDLTHFLLSLEPERVSPECVRSDKTFHSDAMRRAYPWAAHLPFEARDAPRTDAAAHNRAFTVAVARHLIARRKPLELMACVLVAAYRVHAREPPLRRVEPMACGNGALHRPARGCGAMSDVRVSIVVSHAQSV